MYFIIKSIKIKNIGGLTSVRYFIRCFTAIVFCRENKIPEGLNRSWDWLVEGKKMRLLSLDLVFYI